VFGSVVAFTAYIWLLRTTSASRVGTHAYVNPIVAVALGAALGGERVSISTLAAALTIVAGVVLVLVEQSRVVPDPETRVAQRTSEVERPEIGVSAPPRPPRDATTTAAAIRLASR
jgi:hypothetical protein